MHGKKKKASKSRVFYPCPRLVLQLDVYCYRTSQGTAGAGLKEPNLAQDTEQVFSISLFLQLLRLVVLFLNFIKTEQD